MTDLPHHLTNVPSIFAGCLIAAWLAVDTWLTAHNWRTR